MGTALRLSFKVVCCEMVWRICIFMVLLDENERYGCAPTCPSDGMVQPTALWLQVVRTRTITRPDRLHRLKRADLKGVREKWRFVVPWDSTHNHTSYN